LKYLITLLLLSTQLVFAQTINSEKQGAIGLRYTRNTEGMIVVKYIEEKSPAAQAGIQVNDIIISIDGSTLKDMDPSQIKNLLRGKVGSSAEIKLEKAQSKNEYSVSVIRKVVHFGGGDALKDSTKNASQPEVKNVEKIEILPNVAPPKLNVKQAEKSTASANTSLAATTPPQSTSNASLGKTSGSAPNEMKYFIQTGAFFTKEIANDQVAAFNQKGFTSFVDPAKINGSNVYRVRIGPLATQQSAEALSKKLAGQGITNSIIEASQTSPKN